MLLSLNIKNFAIIDSINIDFSEGMNTLTGETGAGKSIAIGALSLVLGYRANIDAIRTGEIKTSIQALFSIEHMTETLNEILNTYSIDNEDNTLLISRELYINGKNICKVNGVLVNVSALKQIGLLLVDLHGQHEHQKLLSPETHIKLLDAFGSTEIGTCKQEVKYLYNLMETAYEKLNTISDDYKRQKEKKDEYSSKLAEINEANLSLGEDDALEKRMKLLQNSEKIFADIEQSYNYLYNDDKSISYMLKQIVSNLHSAKEIDETLGELFTAVSDASIVLDDAVFTLRDYKESIEFDPDELDEIHARLNKINKLKQKYGFNIEEIIAEANKMQASLQLIENIDDELKNAKIDYEEKRAAFITHAKELSTLRQKTAQKLSEDLCENLSLLAMPNTRFDVMFKQLAEERYSADGIDSVEFMISTNAGEELKPLSKIASGGEVSRIMLSIKRILAEADKTGTLIFDEIDTGISGRTAQTVAEQMYSLSRTHQIICITHLPQIACMADAHYTVGKHAEDGKTFTTFTALDPVTRQEELARMLGGVEISNTALEHAADMLEQADLYKKSSFFTL